ILLARSAMHKTPGFEGDRNGEGGTRGQGDWEKGRQGNAFLLPLVPLSPCPPSPSVFHFGILSPRLTRVFRLPFTSRMKIARLAPDFGFLIEAQKTPSPRSSSEGGVKPLNVSSGGPPGTP